MKYPYVRRLLIAGTLLSTIPLTSACGLNNGVAIHQVLPTQHITPTLKKAYYVALSGAIGLNSTADLSVDMGFLKPGSPQAIRVADALVELKKAMDLADVAFKSNDALQLEVNVAKITNITSTIKAALRV